MGRSDNIDRTRFDEFSRRDGPFVDPPKDDQAVKDILFNYFGPNQWQQYYEFHSGREEGLRLAGRARNFARMRGREARESGATLRAQRKSAGQVDFIDSVREALMRLSGVQTGLSRRSTFSGS